MHLRGIRRADISSGGCHGPSPGAQQSGIHLNAETHWTLTVINGAETHALRAADGARVRDVLLAAGLTPHGKLTRGANCGGRGLCATCGVWPDPEPVPAHWHDRAAQRFGYPRLSCQLRVTGPMSITLLPDKIAWGRLIPQLTPPICEEPQE